jgi:ABC-2 type transport system ATP-binding protein
MPVLDAIALTKSYSGLPAVSDVSFALHAGEILGYLGPNGAGKSTTVKILTGLLEPTRGEVMFHGANIRSDLLEYKRRIGYVPEEIQLYGHLTGWEYLELIGALRDLSRRVFAEKSKALLEEFSMYKHRDAPLSSYSKGMRQRIQIIAALMHDPELIILDEPFSGLDVTSALIFRRVIKLLSERERATFFCSHVLEVVEKVCTHLVVLRKGVVVRQGPIAEIRGSIDAALETIFMELTEEVDADEIAGNIVGIITA